MRRLSIGLLCLATALWIAPPKAEAASAYEQDMKFALKELKKKCGKFFKRKGIDWKKVSKEFTKEAKSIKSDPEHLRLMLRLLARIKDGHAAIHAVEKGSELPWPEDMKVRQNAMGMYLCRVEKKVYAKVTFSSAKEVGVMPGAHILKLDGKKIDKWLSDRQAELSDTISYSTDQHAFFATCHWGLTAPEGTRIDVEFKDVKGKKRKRTITVGRARAFVVGPAFLPKGVKSTKDVNYATTEDGWGYIHIRRCKGDMPEQVDQAIAELGNVPGMILDFRGNSGGGFDHDAFFGRFIPGKKKLNGFGAAGPRQYGGPVVVIVDGTVVSAGETASGYFKEFGRAYMIGESPTAGMSSSKETIELPSKKFNLFVSVDSNMHRFNQGEGIEGIGVPPNEVVLFDPKDLAEERDTLIRRAEAILTDFPQKQVKYDPKKFGWKPPE